MLNPEVEENYLEKEICNFKYKFENTDLSPVVLFFPCESNEIVTRIIGVLADKYDLASMSIEYSSRKGIAVYHHKDSECENLQRANWDNIDSKTVDGKVKIVETSAFTEIFDLNSIATVNRTKENDTAEISPDKFAQSKNSDKITYSTIKNHWAGKNIDSDGQVVNSNCITGSNLNGSESNYKSGFEQADRIDVPAEFRKRFNLLRSTCSFVPILEESISNNDAARSNVTKYKIEDAQIDCSVQEEAKLYQRFDLLRSSCIDLPIVKKSNEGFMQNVQKRQTASKNYGTRLKENYSKNKIDLEGQLQNADEQHFTELNSQEETFTTKLYVNSKRRYWNRKKGKGRKNKKQLQSAKTYNKAVDAESELGNGASQTNQPKNNDVQQKVYEFHATPSVHVKICVSERTDINTREYNELEEDPVFKTAKAIQKTISEMSVCKMPNFKTTLDFVKDVFEENRAIAKNQPNMLNEKISNNQGEVLVEGNKGGNVQKSSEIENNVDKENHSNRKTKKTNKRQSKVGNPEMQKENGQEPNDSTNKPNKGKNSKQNIKKNKRNKKKKDKNIVPPATPESVQRSRPLSPIIDEEPKVVKQTPSPIRIKLGTDAVNVKDILNDLDKIKQQKGIKAMKKDGNIMEVFKKMNGNEDVSKTANRDTSHLTGVKEQNSYVVKEIYEKFKTMERWLKEFSIKIATDSSVENFQNTNEDFPELNMQKLENELMGMIKDDFTQIKVVTKEKTVIEENENINATFENAKCGMVTSENYFRLSDIPLAIEVYNIPLKTPNETIMDLYREVSPIIVWLNSRCAILYLDSIKDVEKALTIKHDVIKSRPVNFGTPKPIPSFDSNDNITSEGN